MKKTTNIEFYGGPNSGKSTASSLFSSLLGVNGYVVEIPQKIPSTFVLNNHTISLEDPFLLYFRQLEAIKQLQGETDFAVLDNPILSELAYIGDKKISEVEKDLLSKIILEQRSQFNNLPIYIHKKHEELKPSSYYDKTTSYKKGDDLFNTLKSLNTNFIGEYKSHPLVGIEILNDFYKKEIVDITNLDLKKFLKESETIISKIKNKDDLLTTEYLRNKNTIINLYAGPGSGKSTTSRTWSCI